MSKYGNVITGDTMPTASTPKVPGNPPQDKPKKPELPPAELPNDENNEQK